MSRYERGSGLDKIKNLLRKYIPKPGKVGAVGAIAGSGLAFTLGFSVSSIRYLVKEGLFYMMNGGGMDALAKAYQEGIKVGGEWALIGGLGGMFLFAKFRDYLLELFG